MTATSDLCEKLDASTWKRLRDRLHASRRKRLDAAFKLAECVNDLPWNDDDDYYHELGRLDLAIVTCSSKPMSKTALHQIRLLRPLVALLTRASVAIRAVLTISPDDLRWRALAGDDGSDPIFLNSWAATFKFEARARCPANAEGYRDLASAAAV